MKKHGRLIKILMLVTLILIVSVQISRHKSALRLSDDKVISFGQMISELRGARLIFAGETHDKLKVHKAQLSIIKALYRDDMPLAIGLEMFTTESQKELDRWVAGQLDQDDFEDLFQREWNMPWHLYRDIFLYAREHRVPLIALNIPRKISRKVGRSGFESLTPEERKSLPEGVTCTIDPAYRAFISKAYSMHHGSGRSFDYFCEAQMLWNKGMAWGIKHFFVSNPDYTMVVLAGSGHAMKQGIPEEIDDSGLTYKVVLPDIPDRDRKIEPEDADYLLLFGLQGLVP